MHIGNTAFNSAMHLICAVYPYAYREHTDKEIDDLKKGGLSLCI